MKKNKVKVGNQTFQIAKNYSTTSNELSRVEKKTLSDFGQVKKSCEELSLKSILEEEILGDNESRRSDVKEKNLNQMISGLHGRLGALQEASKIRIQLLAEDVNHHSTKCYEQCPKLADDSDEVIPKSLWQKKTKDSKASHKGDSNLVSTEGVYIDPKHLVMKTKQSTERGKKLETSLENLFGVANLRDVNGKKTKTKKSEKSKLSEQQKSEAKRIIRTKLEKTLLSDVELFVTRSVGDEAVYFKAPGTGLSEIDLMHIWPIPIRWPSRDPRSKMTESTEGMMAPDTLLKLSIAKICLPNGENYFRSLVKQPVIQDYFVALFWCIKVKFFQHDVEKSKERDKEKAVPRRGRHMDTLEDEVFLLRLLSDCYVKIINLLSERAREEHEKDLTFKYLPFILSYAVYLAFFYLIPASRHLYSKGFRKTIYMQTVQIMFGIQLCPVSIRSTWSKLFPEDHDDEEGDVEVGESLPIPIALVGAKKENEFKKTQKLQQLSTNRVDPQIAGHQTQTSNQSQLSQQHYSSKDKEKEKVTRFADAFGTEDISQDQDQLDLMDSSTYFDGKIEPETKIEIPILSPSNIGFNPEKFVQEKNKAKSKSNEDWIRFKERAIARGELATTPEDRIERIEESDFHLGSNASEVIQIESNFKDLKPLNSSQQPMKPSLSIDVDEPFASDPRRNTLSPLKPSSSAPASLLQLKRVPTSTPLTGARIRLSSINDELLSSNANGLATTAVSAPSTRIPRSPVGIGGKEFAVDKLGHLPYHTPISRTNLHPHSLMDQPNPKLYPRQNVEPLNIRGVSPMLQDFFQDQDANINFNRAKEHFKRTLPAPWCIVGGSDTYHKKLVQKELHDELNHQMDHIKKEFIRESILQHKSKVTALKKLETTCENILASGQQKVSRFSLDIIRRQRDPKKNSKDKTSMIGSASDKSMKGLSTLSEEDEIDLDGDEALERQVATTTTIPFDDEEMDRYIESL